MAVPVLQRPDPRVARVGRRPQTSAPQPGVAGPFVRHTQKARRNAFDKAAMPYNSQFGPETIKPVGGYVRYLDVLVAAAAGTLTGAAFQADGPYNVFSSLILRDPYGEPVIDGPGFLIAEVLQLYGGIPDYFGPHVEPKNRSSFANIVAGTGTYQFRFLLPLELTNDAYCSLPSMNAAAQASLQAQFNTAAGVMSGTLTTPGTLQVKAETAYWPIPLDDPNLAPPDLGSSRQWHTVTCPQSPGESANVQVQIPRVGTWLTDIGIELRDSLQVRVEAFPDPVRLMLDGVDLYNEPFNVRTDVMGGQSMIDVKNQAGAALTNWPQRPAGILWYTFRDSTSQFPLQDDVADLYLETTPGTLLEFTGIFGTAGTGPYVLTALLGELYPKSGIPYAQLAA